MDVTEKLILARLMTKTIEPEKIVNDTIQALKAWNENPKDEEFKKRALAELVQAMIKIQDTDKSIEEIVKSSQEAGRADGLLNSIKYQDN